MKDSQIYVDLGSIIQPNILASSLIAYIPVFGKISITGTDYARLLFALAGVADESQGETERDPWPLIERYSDYLAAKIGSADQLDNPYASARMLSRALKLGYVYILPFDYWIKGYFSMWPSDARKKLEQTGIISDLEKNLEKWDRFMHLLKPAADKQARKYEQFHRPTVTLQTDLIWSYIVGVGFASAGNGAVSTCNPKFWQWLGSNFEVCSTSRIQTTEIARLVESAPQRFCVNDVFKLIDHVPVLEELLMAKREYDEKLRTISDLGKETLSFLIQEVVGALVAPIVTTFEIVKMIVRIDFNRWQRKP